MSKQKSIRPKAGDTAWFVEWTTEIVLDECGDVELDLCKTSSRRVASEAEAANVAREVYPLDKFGSVCFWPAEFTPYDESDAVEFPHAGFWEVTADPQYFDGE